MVQCSDNVMVPVGDGEINRFAAVTILNLLQSAISK